jgi:fibronectin type 3 domain-containing protein
VVERREYLDASAAYGRSYRYLVQAIQPAGSVDAESDLSTPVDITPIDRFPPAVPSGLTAVAGNESIELAWEPNQEPDLAGYRVYRAAGDGPLLPLGDLIAAPSYSDRKVESGKRYRYAVSSVDRLGNESRQTDPPAEITAP